MSNFTIARLAGLTYFILVLTGIFYLIYAPGQFVVWDSPAETINKILSNELLFRAWVFVNVISSLVFLILPLILYKLFKAVNKNVAQLMVVLSVISVPFSLSYTINLLDILTLLSGSQYLNGLAMEQIYGQVMLAFRSYVNGMAIVKLFWGLWLFPFGYLVFKSGFLPRILGIALMLGCFSYLIKFSLGILFPAIDIPSFVGYPSAFGEIGTCLWLLIFGIKREKQSESKL